MKKHYLIFFTLTLSLLFGCSNDVETFQTSTKDASIENSELIDKNIVNITSSDAVKVSLLFLSKESPSTTKLNLRSASSANVITMYDSLNVPALYIINYANNSGFTIVSATKKFMPVVAYSETGNFDIDNMNEGVETMIDSYRYTIQSLNSQDADSLRTKYAFEWNSFESKASEETQTRSIIYDKKNEEIRKWTALGYECHDLAAASSFMTPEQYNGFTRDICARTMPQFDCLHSNILLIQRRFAQRKELLATEWHQSEPFNINADNNFAGCVPIAIAQIMRYFQWPQKYDWKKIPTTPTATPETYRFIQDVRNAAKVEYKKDATSSNNEKALGAFKSMGYTASLKSFDPMSGTSTVINELRNGRPVYMSGTRRENGFLGFPKYTGHAWVCDGYKQWQTQYAVAMLLNEPGINTNGKNPNYEFFSGFTDTNTYLHLNWGWGKQLVNPQYNGWYYFTRANPTPSNNYEHDRKIITVSPLR